MTVQKQSAKQKAPPNKKIGNTRDFLPMLLFYTLQVKLSEKQKYTKLNNSELKENPLIPIYF